MGSQSHQDHDVGRLFIKNLHKSIDTQALHDTFSAFGNILSCEIACDNNGSKGHGFVHFETKEAAIEAIDKGNGMILSGKKVYVGHFIPRKEHIMLMGDKPKTCNNVYIKNFAEKLDDDKLRDLFSSYGKIISAKVMTDENGKSCGYGFVSFEKPEGAEKAIEALDGTEIGGRKIYCGHAQKGSERQAELKDRFEKIKMERVNQGVNLYVKNLDDTIDDERLRKEFSQFGTVTSAKIMNDGGRSKGFGFVCFSSPEEATKAVTEMNGRTIASKSLYVALAERKEDRRAKLASNYMQHMARLRQQQTAQFNQMFQPGAGAGFYLPAMSQAQQQCFFTPNQMPQIQARPRGQTHQIPLRSKVSAGFSRNYQQNKKHFHVAGSLAAQACKQWFGCLLDEIKELIIENRGEVYEQPSPSGYMLTYRCPEELLAQVEVKLSTITNGIQTVCVDLRSKFTSYSDQALLINGLHSEEHFCLGVENSLRKEGIECIVAITQPPKCPLPHNRIITRTTISQSRNPSRCLSDTFLNPLDVRSSLEPFSVMVGKTIITVKGGDITNEQVDVIVNAVGEDLKMSRTTLGNAILKKWTAAGEQLLAQLHSVDSLNTKHSQLFATQVPIGQSLRSSFLLHAVVRKWRSHSVHKQLQALVYDCLAKSVQLMQKSIAFPPLGTGRRFGFPEDEVADAMVSSTLEFLKTNPGSLQSIAFIVFDEGMILTFIQCLKEMMLHSDGVKFVSMTNTQKYSETDIYVDSDAEGISGDSDAGDIGGDSDAKGVSGDSDAGGIKDTSLQNADRFEASICFRWPTDENAVVDRLVMQLKETFLYHDSIKEMDSIKKLQQKDFDAIGKTADKNGVVITGGKGNKALTICGQQVGVAKVMAFIRDRLLVVHLQAQKESDKEKQQSHHFPSYWKLCKEHKFEDTEDFYKSEQNYEKLHIADSNERAVIEQLVQNTWDHNFVGKGKDAVSLQHQAIQIIKVERMENPELWERYCEGRNKLLRCLENSKEGVAFSFTPLENVPNSKGPVKTTQLIPQDNLLHSEIYTQINEHYLFHGFKTEVKDAIIRDGLDFRMASNSAMLGRGIYTAESATKADQYADHKSHRTKGNKTMILTRVLLGEPYFNTDLNPPKFSRPPCKKCLKDKCTCVDSKHFDSVIEAYHGRKFREFVVYDINKCYPEYFITYRRV